MRSAHYLALKISLSILGVLLVILGVFGAIGYIRSENQIREKFVSRMNQILDRSRFLERIEITGERVPPFARNLIYVGPEKTTATGFLANLDIDLSFLSGLPFDRINKVSIADTSIYIYGQSTKLGQIYLYESNDPKKEFQSGLLVWGGIAILLFSLVLYAISLRIAKLTLGPIEVARERSRSYNLYLAHELKTPLAVIRSELELTRAGGIYDRMSLESSLEEIALMQETIDALLTLSEAERNMDKIPFPLAPLVQDVAGELQKLPKYSGKDIQISITPDIKVHAVSSLLRSLTRNILENALKYGGTGTIQIEYTRGTLTISNPLTSGVIINTKQIFEEFVGTPGAGSGLWLALVARIADLHGWKVCAKQNEEVFTIVVQRMK